MMQRTVVLIGITLILAACANTPERKEQVRKDQVRKDQGGVHQAKIEDHAVIEPGGYLAGDGPGEDVPANLDSIPDAVPRAEPLHRYANRPYVAMGKTFTPLTVAGNFNERGIASWYGKKYHGQPTSSGDIYDMYGMTAAHPTLPIPSYARVTNTANHKSVVVRINDRGPFVADRVIDLTYTAAYKLDIVGNGNSEVEIESLDSGDSQDTLSPPGIVENKTLINAKQFVVPAKQFNVTKQVKKDVKISPVFLQLGAFKTRKSAEAFLKKIRPKLGKASKQLSIHQNGGLLRVQIGPYANEKEARKSAERMRSVLGFKPMVKMH
jgi:rare lipoprotein A